MIDMKKILIKYLAVCAGLLIPAISFAALVPCNGPDCTFDSLIQLVNNIINWFLGISVSVAAITFMYAGATMLLHPGESGARERAKGMFKKTIIGMIIVLASWLVVHTVIGALVNPAINPLRFLAK